MRRKHFFRTDNTGFSLIELIIIITIMGVLTAVVVPLYISHLENSKIQTDRDTLFSLCNILTYEYAAGNYTSSYIYSQYLGGGTEGSGCPILNIDSHGYVSLTNSSHFQSGEYLYDTFSVSGLDVDALGSGTKIPLFHSKTLIRSGGGSTHVMMSIDDGENLRIWVGNGSNPPESSQFSFGPMTSK